MRLKEKVSVVTGAASGFGKGIAKKFSEEGAKLILADINKDQLEIVSKDLNQDFFHVDVSSSTGMQKLSEYVIKKYGNIDLSTCLKCNFSLGSSPITIDFHSGYLFRILITALPNKSYPLAVFNFPIKQIIFFFFLILTLSLFVDWGITSSLSNLW